MANIRNCSFFHSRILTRGRILFSILAVLAFGVVVNAQTVVRTNGGTETATGTDVSTVQKADGWASGDVISVSGTSATSIAPFSSSVRVESSSNYTVTDFTVQSATGDKQYIGALPNSRNYVLKLGNKNYNLTFKNVEFQNNDIAQNTAGIFMIMDQATSTLTLNLDNASFTKFQGSGDGNYGGIINSSGDLTINGTNTVSFYGNGTGSGGAIFAGKAVTINCDEMIFDNNACNNSGAIRNNNALSITGSKVTFTNNSARNNGGSIYSSSTIAMTGKGDNSVLTFTGNTAANEGGVIYSTGTGIDLDFDTINFSNNQATNFGGAIRFNNTNTNYKLTITGETVTFDNNTALNKNGGAIHTNASVVLKGKSENSVFTITNNTAPKGNSGAIVAVGSVEFSTGSFLFQNNTASGIAGAIEARKGITFSGDSTSATFTGNYAGENGSDLYLSNANSVLTFQDGGTYSFDGGIFLSDASQSVVIDKAKVTIAGRAGVTNNNYQLQTVNISNGGKLTANLDYIDSLTGKFNVEEGTLEFNVGSGAAKELTPSETFTISGYSTGSVVKSGAGKLTLVGDYSYSSPTTVSGGTLLVPTTGTSLATSKVTVASESEAVFQTGKNLYSTEFEIGQGGNFVIGETYASTDIEIGVLTLNGGTISFDFNDCTVVNTSGYNDDADWLGVSSASLTSGVINLTFNSSSAEDWWDLIKNDYSEDGYEIITGAITDYESFDNSKVKVSVNGALSNDWTLTATSDGLFLLAKGDEPAGDPWYYANTGDINADTWTIDGTSKQGVIFDAGDNSATFAGEGGVILGTDGEFEIGTGRTLTISSSVSDGDGVSGGVIKTGDGTLKFTGDTTYTGVTTISEGTLEVNNNNFSSSSALTGDGTLKLKLTGSNKFFDIGDASEFTGTVQVYDENISANSRINLAGNNGTESTNIDLSNATVELNGNATSGKYSELAFYKGGSSLKIGTLNGNKYGRILNVDSSTDAAYNNLTVSEGTYAGEIGRNDNTYKYVNNINLIKTGDGTFTFSGLPYYFGETNIEDGVLKFVNDNASGNKNFSSSSSLKGSGTFEIVGNTNNWVVFAINADASVAQEFSGLLDVSGYMVFNKDTNLGNATLHVGENSIVSMNGGSTKNLTVNELNTEAGSRVRISHANPGEGNFVTLTVGSGTVKGDLGETAYNQYYNWVKLNKVSDGSTDGGTLTLAGAFLYTGETTVSGGTLKLTGNAVVANGKMTVEDNGTLEYNVAGGTKTLAITEQNAIYSTGQIVKTGDGTLQLDAVENSIDAKSLELVEGRLDLKGSMKGDLLVNGGVFSPGNSVGEANVTGNVTITDDGAILFEFSSYDEGLFDVLNIVNGTTENAFTAGDNTIQLYFGSGDAADWAAALEDDPDGYLLVSDNNFSSLGNLSDWLGTNKDLFGLEGKSDGLYLVAAGADPGPGPGPGPGPEPGSGVPEPSTWALMALGVLGLLLRKRVRS